MPHGGAAEEPLAAKMTKSDPEALELAQALAAGQAAKMADPAKAREASGKLISAAERGVLQQVIVILALGADVDTRGAVRAAAGVCFISPQLSCVEEVDFDGRPR